MLAQVKEGASTAIAKKIGHDMCAALPGLHAFTGCDYTSSFVKAGKGRPFTLVEKSHVFKRAFAGLAEQKSLMKS